MESPSTPSSSASTRSGHPQETTRQDCESLNKALEGKAGDIDRAVVEILSDRDATQLQDIKKEYSKKYPKELSAHLSEKLSCDDLKRALSLWTLNEAQRDATIVWEWLNGTKKQALDLVYVTEVIYFQTPKQLDKLKKAYSTMYKSKLVDHIQSYNMPVSGTNAIKKLLRACLEHERKDNKDKNKAEKDAEQLHKDKDEKWDVIENTVIDIFAKRSGEHLAAVDTAYTKQYNSSLQEVVQKDQRFGFFGIGLLILLRCAKNPAEYFAEVLHTAMESPTSPVKLMSVVVTRARIDREVIKKEYKKKRKESLNTAIKKEYQKKYKELLNTAIKEKYKESLNTAKENKTLGHCRTFLLDFVK